MAYRWKGRFFEVDPENPAAEGICSRCGFRFNLKNLVWQYAYQGSPMPQNTNQLVCTRPGCWDQLNPQDMPYILPPDPPPIFNARPENYVLDETNWLTTQDGDIITTEGDTPFITPIPNPGDEAASSHLIARFVTFESTVPVAYLDLFNGDPESGGVSVLELITGSATRTDVAGDLAQYEDLELMVNPDVILIAAESENQTNINYAAIYDAPTDGNLLLSTTLSSHYTIAQGNRVQFDQLDLSVTLGTPEQELLWGALFLTWEAQFLIWGD